MIKSWRSSLPLRENKLRDFSVSRQDKVSGPWGMDSLGPATLHGFEKSEIPERGGVFKNGSDVGDVKGQYEG